jgi:hypothetical protein
LNPEHESNNRINRKTSQHTKNIEPAYPSGSCTEALNRLSLSQISAFYEWPLDARNRSPLFKIELLPLVTAMTHGIFRACATIAIGIGLPNGVGLVKEPNRFYTRTTLFLGIPLYSGVEIHTGPEINYGGRNKIENGLSLEISKCIRCADGRLPLKLSYSLFPGSKQLSIRFGYYITL